MASSPHMWSNLNNIFLLVPCLLVIISHCSSISINPQRFPLLTLMLMFIGYLCLSTLWARGVPNDSYLKRGVVLAVFLLAVGTTPLNQKQIAKLFFVGSCVATTYSTYLLILHSQSSEPRLEGVRALYNPLLTGNLLATYVCLALIAAYFSQKPVIKAIAYSCALTLLITVVQTGTRSSIMGACAGSILIAYASCTNNTHRIITTILIAISTGALILLGSDILTNRGLSYRPEIWLYAIELSRDNHPWFGAGMGSTTLIIPKPGNPSILFSDAHSIHIGYLFYGGIVGLFLWCTLMATAFIKIARQASGDRMWVMLGGMLLCGIVANSFDGGQLLTRPKAGWLQIWFPFALLSSYSAQKMYKRFSTSPTKKARSSNAHDGLMKQTA